MIDDILNVIAPGKSNAREFKATFQKEVIETVVAFANTKVIKVGGVNEWLIFINYPAGLRVSVLFGRMQTSVKNIERWLKELREKGDIEFRGALKTGGYFAN